jgi:hypothetical protein
MSRTAALIAAMALVVTTTGTWAASNDSATSVPSQSAPISTMHLHENANIKDLPVQMIDGLL